MIEFKMEKADLIKKIFTAVGAIVDECYIDFKESGMEIIALDPGRIVLIDLNISMSDFDEYKCVSPVKFSISLLDLNKLMRRAKPNDTLIMKYDENKMNVLTVKFKSNNSKRYKQYKLNLIKMNEQPLNSNPLEDINHICESKLPISFIEEAVMDCEVFGVEISLKIEKEKGISFITEGQCGEGLAFIEAEDIEINTESNLIEENTYAIDSLKDILKSKAISNDVFMYNEKDKPMKLKMNIFSESVITYYISPRVEEEEYDEHY